MNCLHNQKFQFLQDWLPPFLILSRDIQNGGSDVKRKDSLCSRARENVANESNSLEALSASLVIVRIPCIPFLGRSLVS